MFKEGELEILRQQLAEAHATLDAIRSGQVDAVLVDLGSRPEVFTLQPADLPYREFLEQMAEGAVSLAEDGLILYANRFFSELVNVDRENLLGTAFLDCLTESSRPVVEQKLRETRRTSVGASLRLRDGSSLPVGISIAPGVGPHGRRTSIVVSDQRVEHELANQKLAHDEAIAQSRAKDRFLAVLGHELRNPLAALASSVDLLGGAIPPALETEQRVLRGMNRQIAQLRSLIDDLLDLSRVAHGKIQLKKEVVPCEDLFEEAEAAARDLVRSKEQTLIAEPFDSSLCVLGDRTRLEQIISNLLSNAVKYTPRFGSIVLRASKRGESLVVEVTDTGIGLVPEQLERIFEPFVQLHQEGSGGLGIGLTLVRQLVELHGGTIFASSPGIGKGTTVTVRLPQGNATLSRQPSEPPSAQGVRMGGLRVLVVDDNEDAAELLALLLTSYGAEVKTAHEGSPSVTLAEQLEADLAFVDLALPDISGYEVAKRIRQKDQGIKLVALTGFSHADSRVRVKEAGFDAHVVKPLRVSDLADLLARFGLTARS